MEKQIIKLLTNMEKQIIIIIFYGKLLNILVYLDVFSNSKERLRKFFKRIFESNMQIMIFLETPNCRNA